MQLIVCGHLLFVAAHDTVNCKNMFPITPEKPTLLVAYEVKATFNQERVNTSRLELDWAALVCPYAIYLPLGLLLIISAHVHMKHLRSLMNDANIGERVESMF